MTKTVIIAVEFEVPEDFEDFGVLDSLVKSAMDNADYEELTDTTELAGMNPFVYVHSVDEVIDEDDFEATEEDFDE